MNPGTVKIKEVQESVIGFLSVYCNRGYGWGPEGDELPVRPDVDSTIRHVFGCKVFGFGGLLDRVNEIEVSNCRMTHNSDGTIELGFGSVDRDREIILTFRCRRVISYIEVRGLTSGNTISEDSVLYLDATHPGDEAAFLELFYWLEEA